VNLWQKYQRLTFWNKVGVWGSICSIIALLLFLVFPTDSNKQSFNVTSTNIEKSVVMVGNQSSNTVMVDNSIRFLQTNSPGQVQGQIIASNVNITQNINIFTNDTKAIESQLNELKERTKDIQRLPDGRMRIGGLVVGSGSVDPKELTNAFRSYLAGDFPTALQLSQKMITAFEPMPGINISTSSLNPELKREIYALAARSAQRLGSNYLANEFASKTLRHKPTPETKILFVTTLHNLANDYVRSNDFSNALKLDQKAIQNYEGVEVSVSTNFLRRQDALKVYAGAFQNASRLGRTNEANEFLEKGQTIFREITGTH